jgi:hypothetical protein
MIAPLAPALPPLGAGAHAMPWDYLNWKFPNDCVQVFPYNRNRGCHSGGGMLACPQERQNNQRISHENHARRHIMGADAPLPPLRQVPPPPQGLPRRLQTPVFPETGPAPPCRTKALMRGILPIPGIFKIFIA